MRSCRCKGEMEKKEDWKSYSSFNPPLTLHFTLEHLFTLTCCCSCWLGKHCFSFFLSYYHYVFFYIYFPNIGKSAQSSSFFLSRLAKKKKKVKKRKGIRHSYYYHYIFLLLPFYIYFIYIDVVKKRWKSKSKNEKVLKIHEKDGKEKKEFESFMIFERYQSFTDVFSLVRAMR